MLAPNADAYAYALPVFAHIATKVRTVREVYPGLLPNVFADIEELTAAIAENPKLYDAGRASLLDSLNSQPDTEGRAHYGARREHDLSVVLWDSTSRGNQSVSDAFGGLLILANSAATPGGAKKENNIPRAASCFRRALGVGKGTAKLAGNIEGSKSFIGVNADTGPAYQHYVDSSRGQCLNYQSGQLGTTERVDIGHSGLPRRRGRCLSRSSRSLSVSGPTLNALFRSASTSSLKA